MVALAQAVLADLGEGDVHVVRARQVAGGPDERVVVEDVQDARDGDQDVVLVDLRLGGEVVAATAATAVAVAATAAASAALEVVVVLLAVLPAAALLLTALLALLVVALVTAVAVAATAAVTVAAAALAALAGLGLGVLVVLAVLLLRLLGGRLGLRLALGLGGDGLGRRGGAAGVCGGATAAALTGGVVGDRLAGDLDLLLGRRLLGGRLGLVGLLLGGGLVPPVRVREVARRFGLVSVAASALAGAAPLRPALP
ncbi:hypothetical protein GCM10020256_23080 [Streptomyces thermocoprophilus]